MNYLINIAKLIRQALLWACMAVAFIPIALAVLIAKEKPTNPKDLIGS